jgi:two-component system OmpR family response regulator
LLGIFRGPLVCEVLVVDDLECVRTILCEMLEDDGLEVWGAATPEEALALARQHPECSVLVTDIDLGSPDVDGFGLAKEVRGIMPGIPVVFVSGRPWLLDRRPLSSNERALAKPFQKAALVCAVRDLLLPTLSCP